MPAEFVRPFAWSKLAGSLAAAMMLFVLAVYLFHRGLRCHESPSPIQVRC